MDTATSTRLVSWLTSVGGAGFVTEARAALGGPDDLEPTIAQLSGGRLTVVAHESPDPHFTGHDLRVVGLDATAVDEVWSTWVREILRGHRCT